MFVLLLMKTSLRIPFLLLGVCLSLVSCQKEALRITDNQQDDSFLDDANLVGLVQGVTAHDGSHDNVVDDSNCFSINFPYYCNVDGEVFLYQQASDLEGLYLADEVTPVFPITVTYADYNETQINNEAEFQALIAQCASGELYNNAIRCVDFIYPIEVAIYDPVTADFETLVYDHDRATFNGVVSLLDADLIAQFRYPLTVDIRGGETIQISSDSELKAIINSNLNFCE